MTAPLTLYPFQTELVNEARASATAGRHPLITVATGAGKTVVAANIAKRAADLGSSTLFVVHRRELVKQTVATLRKAVGDDFPMGIIAAGFNELPWARLQVASVQTLIRRDLSQLNPDLIIFDEAHHMRASTWELIPLRWPDAIRLGLTATPVRRDGKGLGEHYDDLVLGPPMAELVHGGYLAPTLTLTIPSGLDTSNYKSDRQLAKNVTDQVVASAVQSYLRYCAGRQAIFFGVDRSHSRRVAAEFRDHGVQAAHVDATDSDARRDHIMDSFADGSLEVVTNCQLISEGFDAPDCSVVIIGAYTESVPRYLQECGRAMRYQSGKQAVVLDTAGVSRVLGLPDEPRQWSLEDGEIHARSPSSPKPTVCPDCFTTFYGQVCPSCGRVCTVAAEVTDIDTELVVATGATRKPKMRRGHAMQYAHAAASKCETRGQFIAACARIREEMGFKAGWEYAAARLVWDRR